MLRRGARDGQGRPAALELRTCAGYRQCVEKIWEEQWTAHVLRHGDDETGEVAFAPVVMTPEGNFEAAFRTKDKRGSARARLAAAAPEMAWLLRDLRVSSDLGSGTRGCAYCRAMSTEPHASDCRIIRVLSKAGVA